MLYVLWIYVWSIIQMSFSKTLGWLDKYRNSQSSGELQSNLTPPWKEFCSLKLPFHQRTTLGSIGEKSLGSSFMRVAREPSWIKTLVCGVIRASWHFSAWIIVYHEWHFLENSILASSGILGGQSMISMYLSKKTYNPGSTFYTWFPTICGVCALHHNNLKAIDPSKLETQWHHLSFIKPA